MFLFLFIASRARRCVPNVGRSVALIPPCVVSLECERRADAIFQTTCKLDPRKRRGKSYLAARGQFLSVRRDRSSCPEREGRTVSAATHTSHDKAILSIRT